MNRSDCEPTGYVCLRCGGSIVLCDYGRRSWFGCQSCGREFPDDVFETLPVESVRLRYDNKFYVSSMKTPLDRRHSARGKVIR